MDTLFTCKCCTKNFSNKYNLKRHQNSKICTVEKETIFKCKVCLKILSTKQYLQQHLLKCESKAKKLVDEGKDTKEKIFEVANELKTLLVAFMENNKEEYIQRSIQYHENEKKKLVEMLGL
jgi:uncharacterized Zn-finger protein